MNKIKRLKSREKKLADEVDVRRKAAYRAHDILIKNMNGHWLDVACPHCRAPAGEACHTAAGTPARDAHSRRTNAGRNLYMLTDEYMDLKAEYDRLNSEAKKVSDKLFDVRDQMTRVREEEKKAAELTKRKAVIDQIIASTQDDVRRLIQVSEVNKQGLYRVEYLFNILDLTHDTQLTRDELGRLIAEAHVDVVVGDQYGCREIWNYPGFQVFKCS